MGAPSADPTTSFRSRTGTTEEQAAGDERAGGVGRVPQHHRRGAEGRKLAEEVLQNESRVNQMELEIDDQAISLLALQQPMAGDLRLITSALKINNDLERMGDLAVNIAQRALALMDEPMVQPMIDIPHIGNNDG